MELAPIVLFTYNRPGHVRQTVEALQQNVYAAQSHLIIYSDGARDGQSDDGVTETRRYLKTIGGFRSVRIIERDRNMGLARNLIDGITTVVNRYGNVIVLEDDLVTSPYFLKFMNEALEKYKDDERVASVHGYVYPVKEHLPASYFLRFASSWGWATWKRAWELFEPDGAKLLKEMQDRRLGSTFDFGDSYYFVKMLRNQISGKNNSWAVRWYASVFLKDKLCLYPDRSLVFQNGCDGSGIHSSDDNWFDVELAVSPIELTDIPVEESLEARQVYSRFLRSVKLTYPFKIKNLLKKIYRRYIRGAER